jgi:hypothetical protein
MIRQELSDELVEANAQFDFLRHPGTIPPLRVPAFERLQLTLPSEPESVSQTLGLPTGPQRSERPGLEVMRERYVHGDLEGALASAEALLRVNPLEPEARHYADQSIGQLRQRYLARLGPLKSMPRLLRPLERSGSLKLDHRQAFLLSRIDNQTSLEDLLDLCGMAEHEALRGLCELTAMGLLVFS